MFKLKDLFDGLDVRGGALSLPLLDLVDGTNGSHNRADELAVGVGCRTHKHTHTHTNFVRNYARYCTP
jgi:hypothetical protein